MAQPAGQVNLAAAHASEYFWYAQGTNGIWDAKNGALLTKTGSAGMATEGGAQVALGDAATTYALAATVTLTAPYSLRWRARKTVGQTTNSMPMGNSAGTDSFIWLDNGSGQVSLRVPYTAGGYQAYSQTTSATTTATYTFTMTSAKAWVLYKDGAQIASGTDASGSTGPKFIITTLLGGYSGGSFKLNGAFEFVHLVPDAVLTSGEVSALDADPYSVLDAGGTTITCNLGTATAVGYAASILAATVITCNLGDATASGYQATIQSGNTVACLLGSATASGYQATVVSAGSGTITTEVLKNNTGTVLASQTGATAFIYDVSSGALVVAKTGQTTDATGVMTIVDALITPLTQYRVIVVLSGGAEGMAKYTAS